MPEAKKPAAKKPAAKVKSASQGEKKEIPKVDKEKKYKDAGKYRPKADKNVASYAAVCKVLPATYDEMVKALPEHTDFIGYLIRRGALD